MAHDMKALVKKIQELRHLGIEDHGIELPKICVVGDQSTGKSSLIEGMSEIMVPRSAGTCTRCPMEINLTESGPDQPWKCEVFVTTTHLYDPGRKMKNVIKRLGPWVDIGQSPESERFMEVTDKSELQEVLRCAQLAVLNPQLPPTDFVPGKNADMDDSHYQVKFSPNAVRLDISAPEFPTLSFYDLPGVISQPEVEGEGFLVNLVTNLVKEYISQDNCIVLLTQTMTNDATNSKAAATIATVKGAKSRTLGVLTKPDRVQTGESYAQWREILEGRKFPLGHGYYVVKNNPDASVDHSTARREENEFFASSPWDNELSDYTERLGTRNLQNALSTLLLGQIQGCLPKIIMQIDEKATAIDAELSTLPDLPSENITYLVGRKLYLLEQSIRSQIEGGSSEFRMPKLWNHIAADFKCALNWTRPTIKLLMDNEEALFKAGKIGDDSDLEVVFVQPAKSARKSPGAGAGNRATPVPADAKPDTVQRPKYWTHHFEEFDGPKKRFTLESIRATNEDYYRAGHPGQIDPRALEVMNQDSVLHWMGPMRIFIDASHKLLKRTLMESLDTVFSEYRQTSLYRELKKIMEEYLTEIFHEHSEAAIENYQVEFNKPFTIATANLQAAIDKNHEALKKQRHRFRANAYLNAQGKLPGDPKREAELKKLTDAELGLDQYTREVEMMAVSSPFTVLTGPYRC